MLPQFSNTITATFSALLRFLRRDNFIKQVWSLIFHYETLCIFLLLFFTLIQLYDLGQYCCFRLTWHIFLLLLLYWTSYWDVNINSTSVCFSFRWKLDCFSHYFIIFKRFIYHVLIKLFTFECNFCTLFSWLFPSQLLLHYLLFFFYLLLLNCLFLFFQLSSSLKRYCLILDFDLFWQTLSFYLFNSILIVL